MGLIEGIFPVLMLALAGYIAARSAYLKMPETLALSKFTFNLIIPCLLPLLLVLVLVP